MLQKESWIYISDNTNVRWVKIFQLYKGFFRKKTSVNFFVKGSSRIIEPPRLEYKGFRYKYNLKGDIVRLLIIRLNYNSILNDNSFIKFNINSSISIKKKQDLKSKFLNGPISKNFKRQKFLTLFKVVI
jgi:ribosomal protein L14